MAIIPGLQFTPFTSAEVLFLQNLSGLAYAQGDILYIDSSGDIARLAAGTSGKFLKTQGPGADPIWDTASGSAQNFSDDETPTGDIDGVNTTFTLANTPSPSASILFVVNGMVQYNYGTDYTASGNIITTLVAYPAGSIVRAWYRY